jgi:alpha-amylase
VYKFTEWATDVDTERGNYDYLMFADIDHSNKEVRADLLHWSIWLTSTLGLSGMRLDAMKHYSTAFQVELEKHLHEQFGRDFLIVGEYWTWNALTLSNVIGKFKGRISLFDVQLVYNFSDFSKESKKSKSSVNGDLRRIFDGSLLGMHPQRSVTFVANHDTQETQSFEAVVEPWFVPHAYALILLRQEGTPCVFYGDMWGMNGPRPRALAAGGKLPRLVAARQRYAYGKQKDYFDEPDCIGWTRFGTLSRSNGAGLAVLVNSSWEVRFKKMLVGSNHKGEVWTDIMNWAYGDVLIDDFGYGVFPVAARGISVWVLKGAKGRDKIESLIWDAQNFDSTEK